MSSDTLVLTPRTTRSSSMESTASGRSSRSMRSSPSASTRRSIVRWSWPVRRRASNQLTATAQSASAAAAREHDQRRAVRATASSPVPSTVATSTAEHDEQAGGEPRPTRPTATWRRVGGRRTVGQVVAHVSRPVPVTPGRVRGPRRRSGSASLARLAQSRRRTSRAGAGSPRRGRSGPRRGGSRAGERAPRRRPGRAATPRIAITSVPSSSGRSAASSSAAASSAMRTSRSSMRCDSSAALRALRVVQSQRVSTFSSVEHVAGVAHVAAHGRVAPSHLVGVEAQVQGHQLGDRGDVGRRVAQRLHPLARDARPDRIVVVERGALARLVAAGPRLADVVEQRGEPGDAEVERRVGRAGARSRPPRSCG